jgi:O-succinylbenzoic acid--CoA ligase
MLGYHLDPGGTERAFTADRWLRTGDAGEVDPEGRLRVLGRADGVISTGGEKVWPEEVEAALHDHPAVAEVLVRGRADPEWGERVVAYVVPRSGGDPPTLEDLRRFASQRLARHKGPRELVLVAELPRTSSGKARRSNSSAQE